MLDYNLLKFDTDLDGPKCSVGSLLSFWDQAFDRNTGELVLGRELLVEEIILFFNTLQAEYSTRDCFGIQGEFMAVLLLGIKIYSYCRDEAFNGRMDEDFVKSVQYRTKILSEYWALSLSKRVAPRPHNIGTYSKFGALLCHFGEWVESMPLQKNLYGADVWSILGLGTNTLALGAQVVDSFIVGITHARDHYFLTGNKEQFLDKFRSIISNGFLRMRRHHSCKKLLRQYVSVLSELEATGSSLKRFLQDLESSEKFIKVVDESDRVEFKSKSLFEDESKLRAFEFFQCDRSSEFSDEFCIQIALKTGHIMIEGRNAWERDSWVADIASKYDLQIIRARASRNPDLNVWVSKIQRGFETIVFAMIWAVRLFEEEGLTRIDSKFGMTINFLVCDFAIAILRSAEDCSTNFTTSLWRVTLDTLASWFIIAAKICREGQLPSFGSYILTMLNSFIQFLQVSPKPDTLDLRYLGQAMTELFNAMKSCKDNPNDEDMPMAKYFMDRCIHRCFTKSFPDSQNTEIAFPVLLGSGTFGAIYKCFDLELNTVIALKEISRPESVYEDNVVDEIKYLRFLNHRNIVAFHDAMITDKLIYIKMELCQSGSLLDLINSKSPLTMESFKRITLEVCMGLAYLHLNHIIHGDLKPSNILTCHFGVIKLADFGTAHCLTKSKRGTIPFGTIQYTAPEVLIGGAVSLASDMWSLGCTLFHLVTGITPYSDCHDNPWQILLKASNRELFDLAPLWECSLDQKAKEIIASCLKFDPAQRPVITGICQLEYFYELDSCIT